MPVIDINGVGLNYRELGSRDRRTVVFAHPVLFDSTVFDHLVSELAPGFHLILLDIHGHGESGYRTPLTLEDMADDYYQLLTKLNLPKVTWVGYSIGGMVGMRLALAHPEAIDSLILMATTARLDPPQLREQTWALWEMFRAGHREEIVDAALPFFFAAATFRSQPQLVADYRDKVASYNQAQAEGIFEAARATFARADISERLGAIEAPTLAIAGKEDPLAPPEELELIASRIPNARLAIVEETSHLLLAERPQQVAQIVRDFLQKGKAAGEGSGALP
jgi:pimeloyl-ACP methyl ester carboxylesterase